jgi:hypothetical protein
MTKAEYTLLARQAPDGTVHAGPDGCGLGSCPAVILKADGNALVVGRLLSTAEQAAIAASGLVGFGPGEFAVEVSPELLRQAMNK